MKFEEFMDDTNSAARSESESESRSSFLRFFPEFRRLGEETVGGDDESDKTNEAE